MKKAKKILFICLGNICRSPMAENIANSLLSKKESKEFLFSSAGLFAETGCGMQADAITALAELNIKAKKHAARQFVKQMCEDSDYIICLTQEYKDALHGVPRVFTLGQVCGGGDIEDPYLQGLEKYREIAQQLKRGITILIEKLRKGESLGDNFRQ